MPASQKRKATRSEAPDTRDTREPKRSKGGSGGRWQTPHQKAVAAARTEVEIEIGGSGIWATCARGQESRATEELKNFLEDSAEKYYGLKKTSAAHGDEDEEDGDIEASIQKELTETKTTPRVFEYVRLELPCLLFFNVRPPIESVDLVHRICKDVVANPTVRKLKYINRLSPVSTTVKATEKGLHELSQKVLAKHFKMSSAKTTNLSDESASAPSYAIRPFIRAHNNLKRDVVIKQIASSIHEDHKVDLTAPDRVIIVEIYQGYCGMSVVDGDWESLKRYNLAELYPKPDTSSSVKDSEKDSDPAVETST